MKILDSAIPPLDSMTIFVTASKAVYVCGHFISFISYSLITEKIGNHFFPLHLLFTSQLPAEVTDTSLSFIFNDTNLSPNGSFTHPFASGNMQNWVASWSTTLHPSLSFQDVLSCMLCIKIEQ